MVERRAALTVDLRVQLRADLSAMKETVGRDMKWVDVKAAAKVVRKDPLKVGKMAQSKVGLRASDWDVMTAEQWAGLLVA